MTLQNNELQCSNMYQEQFTALKQWAEAKVPASLIKDISDDAIRHYYQKKINAALTVVVKNDRDKRLKLISKFINRRVSSSNHMTWAEGKAFVMCAYKNNTYNLDFLEYLNEQAE